MLTTNVVGGLGNQMFLMANLLATAHRNRLQMALPRVEWSSSCGAPRPTYWASMFERLTEFGVLGEVPSSASGLERVVVPEVRPTGPIRLDAGRPCIYDLVGFFQSEAYFRDAPFIVECVPARLREVAERHLLDNYTPGAVGDRPHTVGVHLRRGDYVGMTDVFAYLDVEYYDRAVRHLLGGLLVAPEGRVQLLIFSEDRREGQLLCAYFQCKYAGLSVRLVHPSSEKKSSLAESARCPREVIEMLMLANCNDVVMANSSFSWWGAYLNIRPFHRVVSPVQWFVQHPYPQSNHLYCDDWVLL